MFGVLVYGYFLEWRDVIMAILSSFRGFFFFFFEDYIFFAMVKYFEFS
jgi:hypothetical protein